MKFKKIVTLTLFICSSIFLYQSLTAYSLGIIGSTRKYGWEGGCRCHDKILTPGVSVIISGPAFVQAGDTATYRLKLFGGPLTAGGCDISAQFGSLETSYLESQLQLKVNELTQTSPKLSSGGDTISWIFKYKAPETHSVGDTLFATSNSVNLNGNFTGDAWNSAANFVINITPPTSIVKNTETVNEYNLSQNYPNPFNPSTRINFSLLKSGFVSLKLYDNLGRLAARLVNEDLAAGNYEVTMDAGSYGLTSGMYYYKLETNGFSKIKKMVLTK